MKNSADHFADAGKMVKLGSGSEGEIADIYDHSLDLLWVSREHTELHIDALGK